MTLLALVVTSLVLSPAEADTAFPPATGPFTLTVTADGVPYTYTGGPTGPTIPVEDGEELTVSISSEGPTFSRLRARQCAADRAVNNGTEFNPQIFNRCTSTKLGNGSNNGFVDSGPLAPGTTSASITFFAGEGTAPDVVSAFDGEVYPGFTCGPTGACKLVVNAEVTSDGGSSNYLSFPINFATVAPPACGAPGADTVSIGDAAVLEGDSGAERTLKLPITLSNNLASEASVDFLVVPGTATIPADLPKVKPGVVKTVKFKPSPTTLVTTTQKYAVVKVAPDALAEGDEQFTVVLSNPTGGLSIGRAVGTATIVDDEGTGQSVAITGTAICEGNAFTPAPSGAPKANKMQYNVTLSEPAATDLEVTVALTDDGTTPDLAPYVAPLGDYKGFKAPKVLKFKAGQVQRPVTVQVFADTDVETDESVVGTVTSSPLPVQVAVADATILNDD